MLMRKTAARPKMTRGIEALVTRIDNVGKAVHHRHLAGSGPLSGTATLFVVLKPGRNFAPFSLWGVQDRLPTTSECMSGSRPIR